MPDAPPVIRGCGHSVRRKEDPRFIRGQGNYIDDIKLPGMLYMDIVRSPYAHATIKSIDSSAALQAPGVVAVITGKDLAAAGLAWMPTLMSDTQMVLPTDHVVYQSQEVACVLAEDRYQITLAVAGFSPDEVSITAEQNVVTIEGGKTEKAEREFLYRGISTRHFKRQFSLADYVQVKGATFDNGLLKIELVREIPEAMKPRRIAINGASTADNVHQIEAKAA